MYEVGTLFIAILHRKMEGLEFKLPVKVGI